MPFTEGTLPSYPRPHLSPTPTLTAPCLVAVPDRISFPEKEEEILAWWEENGVFQESLKQSLGKPVWSFYDGPPFATGLPHYGHLLAGTIKAAAASPKPYPPDTGHPRPTVPGSRARAAGRRTSSVGTRTRPATTSSAASAGTATACPSSSRSIRCSASRVRRIGIRLGTARHRERSSPPGTVPLCLGCEGASITAPCSVHAVSRLGTPNERPIHLSGKEDVLGMGIDKYNAECRAIVMRYSGEWQKTVKRIGRWIEFDTGYKTMDLNFMETVWWVFKQLQDKGLVCARLCKTSSATPGGCGCGCG